MVKASNTANADTIRIKLCRQHPGFMLDVDLTLPAGQINAIMGPSGSGKTSILRAIAGLDRAASGQIIVQGQVWQDDTNGQFVPTHQRGVGYVFQESSLFTHLNVLENLRFGLKRAKHKSISLSLEHCTVLLGLNALLERSTTTLSGGERQRVAIARALLSSPGLLLLDEPLAALDGQRKAELLPYLESMHRELDIPVLYVSHAADEVARLADHLVLLEAGRVRASGAVTELLTRLDSTLAHGDSAAGVLIATISGHEPEYGLTYADFDGGQLALTENLQPPGRSVRLRIQARDVSLTLEHQSGTSILNILPAQVADLSPDGPGQVMVRLMVGSSALLARISAKSAAALGLQRGQPVFAQVKGVAVIK